MATSREIRTERLILRLPTAADLPAVESLWRDPGLLRHIGQPARTDECWARLLKYTGHQALFGFGYWLIEEAASGRFAGEAGVAFQRRHHLPGLGDDPEAGWMLAGWAQGKGYAGEALAALIADAGRRGFARITCIIAPDNLASIRLAERQGFRAFGASEAGDLLLFERIAA